MPLLVNGRNGRKRILGTTQSICGGELRFSFGSKLKELQKLSRHWYCGVFYFVLRFSHQRWTQTQKQRGIEENKCKRVREEEGTEEDEHRTKDDLGEK